MKVYRVKYDTEWSNQTWIVSADNQEQLLGFNYPNDNEFHNKKGRSDIEEIENLIDTIGTPRIIDSFFEGE
ncbi:MAG: hypothetical protein JETCAE03_31830 [Ignavibacteriaceae bacterium]|jgi:hypothetical protein|nr:MAG: hypothetical protein JETCAE03_31830 [Ignavibacteriaceae bacterium]